MISVRSLVDRLRHPISRVRELESLRARFAAQRSRREAGPELVAMAEEVKQKKLELADALAGAKACSGCAVRHPPPGGHWPGGYCCGTQTLAVFSQNEVAALKLSGTRATRLTPPAGDHAGCTFRSGIGCSLDVADRPSICVRYVCLELRAELRAEPRWKRISICSRALDVAFTRFEKALDEKANELG